MIITQSANQAAPLNNLRCLRCNSVLSPQTVLCSFCGQRVGVQTFQSIQGSRPIYRAGLSRVQLKHWRPDQQPQNEVIAQQLTKSSPLLQSIELSEEIASPMPQRNGVLKLSMSTWLWPMIIILSAIVVGLVTFVIPTTIVRPIVVMWFLFVCPGMVTIRFLRLEKQIVQWTLAIALSFAIDAIVAGLLLYAGGWSPTAILCILIAFSLGGAIVQLATLRSSTTRRRFDAFRNSFRRVA